MKPSRTMGVRMLMIVFAVMYTVVCYFAFVSLPELKDSTVRSANRFHPRGAAVAESNAETGAFKSRADARLQELRLRLNASFSELLEINKDIQQRKVDTGDTKDEPADKVPQKQAKVPEHIADKAIDTDAVADKETEAEKRRAFVKKMMEHAWGGYVKHAWGQSELRPDSLRGHNPGIFGNFPMGASIVDAMDTLFVMDMHEEFQRATQWVQDSLHFDQLRVEVSVFEFTIRYLGGLLSSYALSNNKMFLTKAKQLADLLLPAFNTPSGVPYSLLNLHTKQAKNYNWANNMCSILAEVGTLHMEFAYLSELTGEPVYEQKVRKIREVLRKQPKWNGLYKNYLSPNDGAWCGDETSIGALGDSFYEYLLKDWLRTGQSDATVRDMFDQAVEGVRSQLQQRSPSGFLYFAERRNGILQHRVDHLSCYFGGTLALGAQHVPDADTRLAWLHTASEFTRTCHESYVRTASHLGPDTFHFSSSEFSTQTPQERVYLLRPEVIESYFYMWRFTHNETYRDWAWDAVQAIEKHCRGSAGYSGIADVSSAQPLHDDVQQSYFLAETLKYLYLIFSPDSVLPLDKWVFNTEAHPLPIVA